MKEQRNHPILTTTVYLSANANFMREFFYEAGNVHIEVILVLLLFPMCWDKVVCGANKTFGRNKRAKRCSLERERESIKATENVLDRDRRSKRRK